MNDVDERVRALRPDALTEDAYRRRRAADLARAFATAVSRSGHESGHASDPVSGHGSDPVSDVVSGHASDPVSLRVSTGAPRPLSRPRLTPGVVLTGALVGLAAAVTVPAVMTGTVGLRGPGGGRTAAIASQYPAQDPVSASQAPGPVSASQAPASASPDPASNTSPDPVSGTSPVPSSKSEVRPPETSGSLPAATPGTPVVTLDARSFLLAGAETAARETSPEGRYWFERTRTFEPVGSGATAAHTDESWYDGRAGRTVSNQDVEITFATEAAKAAWKAKGSPALWPGPRTDDFSRLSLRWRVGSETLTLDEVRDLPGDAGELERWLRSAHRDGPFPAFAFAAARYLLASPASPATRAATLRVLAAQPGIVLEKDVLDPLGRLGSAVTTADGHHTLVVDESGSRLLAFAYTGPDERPRTGDRSVHVPFREGLRIAYEDSGWVGKVGVRR
ncbi:hypothetical protein [Streptosporangium sp. V21-05]|uniref:hypothetical protein n=1 Tax=Streptosporangium sp. V21-05 TaxID=3446115 RepID=UPI003F53B18A